MTRVAAISRALLLVSIATVISSYFAPISLAADAGDEATGLKPISGDECATLGIGCPAGVDTADATTVIDFALKIINATLGLTALLAIIIIIISGVILIASLGDEDSAKRAKHIILYAVIGLVVIGIAAAIVNFVTGVIKP